MINYIKRLKDSRHSIGYFIRSLICRMILPISQKLGINITVNHYYSPIPDLRDVKQLYDKYSEHGNGPCGLNFNLNNHLLFIENIETEVNEFYNSELGGIINNSSFGPVDAEILYSMIRKNKPAKVIEIGGGASTKIVSNAIKKNKMEKDQCEYLCIEPYPTKKLVDVINGCGRLIENKVEYTDLTLFTGLGENDILFIDSSHVVKPYNDVYFEFFKILPVLNKGVLIHFHDIYLPAEYPLTNLNKYNYFWNEQYMLHSFLLYNDCFKIEWAGSFAHINIFEKLEKHFKSYNRGKAWPGSFWIRKIH